MKQRAIGIIIPCYNESGVVTRFLESLEKALCTLSYDFHVVVVNDCSSDDTLPQLNRFRFDAPNTAFHIITLAANAGHQAAIYQGFLFAETLPCGSCIVMDADGQDDPSVIAQLLQCSGADIVHVARGKRNDPVFFRLCYSVYKAAFRLATGRRMNYGNYCLISRSVLQAAIQTRFTHLAAFLAKQRASRQYIVAERKPRIGGRSKMSFGKLCRHAISSFTEYWSGAKLPRSLPLLIGLLFTSCNSMPVIIPYSIAGTIRIGPPAMGVYSSEHSWCHGYQYTVTANELLPP